jgi:hypothetical protein
MVMDWFTVGGLVLATGVLAVLAYLCKTAGCGR